MTLLSHIILSFVSYHSYTLIPTTNPLQKRFDQWILQRYREHCIVTLKKIEESKISFSKSFICLTCQASLLQIYEKNHLIPKTFDRL